jgi:hypothetical protein
MLIIVAGKCISLNGTFHSSHSFLLCTSACVVHSHPVENLIDPTSQLENVLVDYYLYFVELCRIF